MRKGQKATPEQRENMSVAHRGKKQPLELVAKRAASNTGKKRTIEQRATMSAAAKKRGVSPAFLEASLQFRFASGRQVPEETRRRQGEARKGHVVTDATRGKIRAGHMAFWDAEARKNQSERVSQMVADGQWPSYVDGRSKERNGERYSHENKEWRRAVFKRDDYTCQRCGDRGGNLEAHHIKGWAPFEDLRYVVSNGVTLRVECHKIVDPWRARRARRAPIEDAA